MTHGRQRSLWPLMDEASLDEHAMGCAKIGGWNLAYHTHRSKHSAAGFPDRIWIHTERRLIVAAELKGYDARGRLGVASPDQLAWLAGLRAAGVPAFLWTPDDVDQVADVLLRRVIPADLPDLPKPRRGRPAPSRLR